MTLKITADINISGPNIVMNCQHETKDDTHSKVHFHDFKTTGPVTVNGLSFGKCFNIRPVYVFPANPTVLLNGVYWEYDYATQIKVYGEVLYKQRYLDDQIFSLASGRTFEIGCGSTLHELLGSPKILSQNEDNFTCLLVPCNIQLPVSTHKVSNKIGFMKDIRRLLGLKNSEHERPKRLFQVKGTVSPTNVEIYLELYYNDDFGTRVDSIYNMRAIDLTLFFGKYAIIHCDAVFIISKMTRSMLKGQYVEKQSGLSLRLETYQKIVSEQKLLYHYPIAEFLSNSLQIADISRHATLRLKNYLSYTLVHNGTIQKTGKNLILWSYVSIVMGSILETGRENFGSRMITFHFVFSNDSPHRIRMLLFSASGSSMSNGEKTDADEIQRVVRESIDKTHELNSKKVKFITYQGEHQFVNHPVQLDRPEDKKDDITLSLFSSVIEALCGTGHYIHSQFSNCVDLKRCEKSIALLKETITTNEVQMYWNEWVSKNNDSIVQAYGEFLPHVKPTRAQFIVHTYYWTTRMCIPSSVALDGFGSVLQGRRHTLTEYNCQPALDEIQKKLLSCESINSRAVREALKNIYTSISHLSNYQLACLLSRCSESNLLDYIFKSYEQGVNLLNPKGYHVSFSMWAPYYSKTDKQNMIIPPCQICDRQFLFNIMAQQNGIKFRAIPENN